MSQNTVGNANQESHVNVSMATIIDQLHTRYTRQVAQLMQENAELAGLAEALGAELDELRSRTAARAQAARAQNALGIPPFLAHQGLDEWAAEKLESSRQTKSATPPTEAGMGSFDDDVPTPEDDGPPLG